MSVALPNWMERWSALGGTRHTIMAGVSMTVSCLSFSVLDDDTFPQIFDGTITTLHEMTQSQGGGSKMHHVFLTTSEEHYGCHHLAAI